MVGFVSGPLALGARRCPFEVQPRPMRRTLHAIVLDRVRVLNTSEPSRQVGSTRPALLNLDFNAPTDNSKVKPGASTAQTHQRVQSARSRYAWRQKRTARASLFWTRLVDSASSAAVSCSLWLIAGLVLDQRETEEVPGQLIATKRCHPVTRTRARSRVHSQAAARVRDVGERQAERGQAGDRTPPLPTANDTDPEHRKKHAARLAGRRPGQGGRGRGRGRGRGGTLLRSGYR